MKRLALVLLGCLSTLSVWAAPLDSLLANPGLWALKPTDFETSVKGLGFRWLSQNHDAARSAAPELTAFGQPVVEAIVRFNGEQMKEITLAIYARGDAGELSKDEYDALIRKSVEAFNSATGTKFTPRGKDASNIVKADGVFWDNAQAHYLLEYSATREVKTRDIPFRAEFVRMEMTPPQKKPTLLSANTAPLVHARFNGPQHLKRDETSGDVWIGDVPMVDQGQKGYCVVAATERVMRYYGSQVDANELAQLANTDADGGTSYEGMFVALKKVSARLKVKVRQLEETDVKGILALMKDYNRAAKKAGATEIPPPGHMINVGGTYRAMELPVLKEVRTHNRSDVGRFQREIQQNIDTGVPLLWSVQLGLVPEKGIPPGAGGHMRLIIGYNSKTEEVLFTDTWGAGHELKRMAGDDAWSITTGLAKIEPL